ncbi:N-acetylmuramidase family protein [Paraburkholderia sp. B3]|uniref:N-acetylmuramidase family protein n=1 Tax=Paraburkholderia sp. B3 TaxID=3134791 RepID=UPI003981BDF2
MAHPHHPQQPAAPQTPPSPYVQVTFVFRDTLQKPIEGLSVQIKGGTGTPAAPAWTFGQATDGSPAPDPSVPLVDNKTEVATDADGYAMTIQNAARNQPIDVLVKNRRGEYVWKATVTPKKDISAFTIVSPEYHIEATTKLTPKEELEQNLDLPVVKDGEVMTIERLVHDFGPYIGWSQKVTEQGKVKKDFPEKHRETTTDDKTGKKKTTTTIEHHYKVVDNGKPRTVVLNVLGSRLNYPNPAAFTEDHFNYLATSFGCEAAAVKALTKQETIGKGKWVLDHGFDSNGLPRILFERHHFYDFTAPPIDKKTKKRPPHPYALKYPDICNPKSGEFGAEGLHQYERFVRATNLDLDAAIMSCSWGGFQVLGEYYESCGCDSPIELVNEYMKGVDAHVLMFEKFMKKEKALAIHGLANKKWEEVASSYNGTKWKIHNPNYAADLEEFYNELK